MAVIRNDICVAHNDGRFAHLTRRRGDVPEFVADAGVHGGLRETHVASVRWRP
jgi:hypothetical protein